MKNEKKFIKRIFLRWKTLKIYLRSCNKLHKTIVLRSEKFRFSKRLRN